MRNSYLGITYELQALRRRVEGAGSATAMALGVRAQIYPYQVENIDTILGAPEIRHLLADEVGLGKTVQAIMVINAVRQQQPDARIAVLVPDLLVTKWKNELISRGHEAPEFEEAKRVEDKRNVSLFWPAILKGSLKKSSKPDASLNQGDALRSAKLNPETFSLLIIDEIHNLTTDIRDYLVTNASKFSGILLLSATPDFRDPSRHLEILAILEPNRVKAAVRQIKKDGAVLEGGLRRWPRQVHLSILKALETEERRSTIGINQLSREDASLLAQRHCIHRRILRASRVGLGGLLPMRSHSWNRIEPSDAEIERSNALRAYRESQRLGSLNFALFTRKVFLGGPSLINRIGPMLQSKLDFDGHLLKIHDSARISVGDTRLDALCDRLNDLWIGNPFEKVVVVCDDNPTIDYLRKKVDARLSRIGPRGQQLNLVSLVARKNEESADDVSGVGSDAQAAVREFQRGAAQVLFAGDIANVGLDLQCSRVLIFYCVPWEPSKVEQWIGRIDRVGNEAALEEDSSTRSIEVHTLSHIGLLDSRVVEIHESSGVFDKPLNPAGEEAAAANQQILEVILGAGPEPDGESPSKYEGGEIGVPLREYLPTRWRCRKGVGDLVVEPVLLPEDSTSGQSSETIKAQALEAWLRLMSMGEEYKFYYVKELDAGLFRHAFQDSDRPIRCSSDVHPSGLVETSNRSGTSEFGGRDPRSSVALVTRRQQIQQPPRETVTITPRFDADPKVVPLQYMNHGGLLHDDLVSSWMNDGVVRCPAHIKIRPPAGHHILTAVGDGAFLASVGWIDSAKQLLPNAETLLNELEQDSDNELDPLLLRHHFWAHSADTRWLRNLLPAQTFCYAKRSGGPDPLVKNAAWSFFKPQLFSIDSHGQSEVGQVGFALLENEIPELVDHASKARVWFRLEAVEHWAKHLVHLPKAIDVRSRLVLDMHEGELGQMVDRHEEFRQRAAALDERAARIPSGMADSLEKQVLQLKQQTEQRLAWLSALNTKAFAPEVELFNTYFFEVLPPIK
jgi:ATP-dependent helicase HepA